MNLVDSVFATSRSIPRIEFDLKRQINRAAVSIPSHVAEGWKRKRRRAAYQNHVSIAMGSHAELETQLEICFRNSLLDRNKCEHTVVLLNRVGPLLEKLFDSLD
ncbi:MAG: four helix bundle protein [Cyanobacteria bacterium]|nr:four helix bundle protein [Cyanobacteriota bacterium]